MVIKRKPFKPTQTRSTGWTFSGWNNNQMCGFAC